MLWALWYVVSTVVGAVTRAVVLPVVRWYLDHAGPAYRRFWFWQGTHRCLDGFHPADNHTLILDVAYGSGPEETVDVVLPTGLTCEKPCPPAHAPVVVYLHGGGFVACTSECLLHSIPIPLARSGLLVYSINYPLAPEAQYPAAVLSAIKGLRWVRERSGATEVVLVGDSAGGAVAATVAAILSSDRLTKSFATDTGAAIDTWELPTVSKLVSVYGVMDWHGWSSERDPVTGKRPELRWNDYIGAEVLKFCLSCYCPAGSQTAVLGGKCLFSDFSDEDLGSYPPTLLVCGTWDPLIHGTRIAHDRLNALGRACELREYEAHHAFVGMPIAWNWHWRSNAYPAYLDICRFVMDGKPPTIHPGWPCGVGFDWSMPVALVLAVLFLPVALVLVLMGKSARAYRHLIKSL